MINIYLFVFSKSEVQSQSEQNSDLQVTQSSCCWVTFSPSQGSFDPKKPTQVSFKKQEESLSWAV